MRFLAAIAASLLLATSAQAAEITRTGSTILIRGLIKKGEKETSGTPLAASAKDCPTKQSGSRGFVVERGDKQKSEILHSDGGIVHTVMRYNGVPLLETMQYEGLFQLDRLEEGRRTKFEPRTNLKTLLPLKPKQTVKAEFTWERDGQSGVLLVEMAVKGFEDLYIGLCKYSVLKIERSETGSANPPRFVYSEYYSPLLKLSLAKEYRYADGRTQIVKFDRIYLKPPTPGGALGQLGQDSGRLSPPRKVVITADGGGLVESYEAFWQNLADKGAEVEIRGDCASACTLVISYIPKERLCFDANGLLLFHMATQVSRQGLKNPDPLRTEAMVDSYPDDIRAWISKQGGYRMMPWKNHWWMLRARELWAMGYRRCSD